MQRRALVTGASRGIGAAIVRELAAAGAEVAVAARTLADCEALADEVRAGGGSAFALELDVSERESVLRAAEQAGPVDWLVNNAGIAVSAPLLPKGDEADRDFVEEHLLVNFHGARWMIEALLPGMRERDYGRVVNVASAAALRGWAYVSAYCASKHALLGYTRAAALELAKTNVRFHAVCPHYVDSPMTDHSVRRVMEKTGMTEEAARAFFAEQNPAGRLVTPEEVAGPCASCARGTGTAA